LQLHCAEEESSAFAAKKGTFMNMAQEVGKENGGA
jgi:hypothetical protein